MMVQLGASPPHGEGGSGGPGTSHETQAQAPRKHEEWRTRKYHTKSRNGCMSCKKRRKRCDQRKPVCSACLSRGSICLYESGITGVGTTTSSNSDSNTIPKPTSGYAAAAAAHQQHHHQSGSAPLVRILSEDRRDPFDSMSARMPHDSHRLYDHWVFFRQQQDKILNRDPHIATVILPEDNPYRLATLMLVAAGHLNAVSNPGEGMVRATTYQRSEVITLSRVFIREFMKLDESQMHESYSTLTRGMFVVDLALGELGAAETHVRAFHSVFDAKERQGAEHMYLQLGINQNFFFFGLYWASMKAREAAAAGTNLPGLAGGYGPGLARSLSTALCIWCVLLSKFVIVQPAFWEPDEKVRRILHWLLPAASGVLLKWLLEELRADRAAQVAEQREWDRERILGSSESDESRRSPAYQSLQGSLYDPRTKQFEWKLALATHALAIGARRDVQHPQITPPTGARYTNLSDGAEAGHDVPASSGIPSPRSSPSLLPIRTKPKETPMDRLRELRQWTARMQTKWRQAPRMVEWDGAQEILGRILWLSTDEGLEVLELICAESIPEWVSDRDKDDAASAHAVR